MLLLEGNDLKIVVIPGSLVGLINNVVFIQLHQEFFWCNYYLQLKDKASGQSVIQDLKLAGYNNITPIKPKLDKVTRFASIVAIFQSGQAVLPEKAAYKRELLGELTSFPNAKNDDIVDSVSQFLHFSKDMRNKGRMRVRLV